MNTKNLKAYAPKARTQFIEAVKKRAAHFGIYENRIEQVRIEGGAAIIEGRAFTRKEGEQRKRLESKVTERGYEMFIREMAYTWFNRLAAIRYMEIHDYFDHGFRVLSSAKSHTTNSDSLPEILSHASDVADSLGLDKSHVIELQLAGDKEEELYRELLLGQCHHLSKIMPFMFEAIDDATELLLPNNLTKTDSILKGLINDIPEEDWQEIEVIGWLYQFYISEHKDAVIGKVVKSEDIPAATQLFTPNWIVKYLVQNSVGRQWLATYPDSELKGKMDYYIEPAEQSDEVIEQLKAITPTSIDPEEIKVLDPACGSGHILVEVYEVLREIYLERGYRLREIPELILTKNIYGLDIDDRAAQLAGFALMMKAREDDRRIFQRAENRKIALNIFPFKSTGHLDISKLWDALNLDEKQRTGSSGDLFEQYQALAQPKGAADDYFKILHMLHSKFLNANTFGSLIEVERALLKSLLALQAKLDEKAHGPDPAAKKAASILSPVLNQAIVLARAYDVVVANPPYMGGKGMNIDLKNFAAKHFQNSRADLFSMFMERAFSFLKTNGFNAQVNLQSWMYLNGFRNLRSWIINRKAVKNILHIGYNSFPELNSKVVQCVAFVIANCSTKGEKATFIDLNKAPQSSNKKQVFENIPTEDYINISPSDFLKIPSAPFAYDIGSDLTNAFQRGVSLAELGDAVKGLDTCDNERFVRLWHEVSFSNIGFKCVDTKETRGLECKWYPYSKGGAFRKWYGNNEYVVNWQYDGRELKGFKDKEGKLKSRPQSINKYFKEGITFGAITSSDFNCRFMQNSIFGGGGNAIFVKEPRFIMGLLNSIVAKKITNALNPTLNMLVGDLLRIPVINCENTNKVTENVDRLIALQKIKWDSNETSWNFKSLFINGSKNIKSWLDKILTEQNEINSELSSRENDNDRFFSEVYGTQFSNESKHLTVSELNSKPELVIKLISFALGCMTGRYSLDREGVVYANSENEGFKEIVAEGAYETYPADEDGIIPLSSEEWLFVDDATTRLKEFFETVWGVECLPKNLEVVAESLCLNALKPKKGENAMETIRRYFSTQFFKDHCKTYKKRPIYWLFSSGKEKAFECLVYLHRYNEGTLSRMRTEYVTPLMGKYDAQHTLLSEQQLQATGTESRRIEKELKSLEKKQAELRTFDEQLKHYAEMRITLDLDDGVKANYGKFGNLLADVKAIHGKEVK